MYQHDVVAVGSQTIDDTARYVLVGKEVHSSPGRQDCFVLQVVSGKRERCPDIVFRQARIGFDQLGNRSASRQPAQNELDRQARVSDARLAKHDGRIGGNAWVRHGLWFQTVIV